MQAATIKLFLVHGSPTGLRTAELSNWSGKAIAAPRTELAELLKREELDNPGDYLLSGVDPSSGERTIYIGEAENVTKRIKNHREKDYWNAVTVFVSKDDNLTKAHIRYVEGLLIERAAENGVATMNAAASGAKLPESDTAEMNVFLEKCLQLLPVLGISDFNDKVEKADIDRDLLYCKYKTLMATGKRTANGFVVFTGSQAVLTNLPSAENAIVARRQNLLDKGLLVHKEGHLLFTKDVEFGSPSTAACMVRGGNTNGLTSWKNATGVTLKELENDDTSSIVEQ